MLIRAGVPLPVIQRRLGHESIQTTIDVYGHLDASAGTLAAEATDRALADQVWPTSRAAPTASVSWISASPRRMTASAMARSGGASRTSPEAGCQSLMRWADSPAWSRMLCKEGGVVTTSSV